MWLTLPILLYLHLKVNKTQTKLCVKSNEIKVNF